MTDFSSCKPGDRVFLECGGWSRSLQIRNIEKVGKIHFTLVGSAQKYRTRDGRQAGNQYSREYVTAFDEREWLDYVEEKQLARRRQELEHFDWRNCDRELIDKAFALLPKKVNV